MTDKQKPHHRIGYRKPDAKRATLSLRLSDEDKALLQDQADAVGHTIAEHIMTLARAQESRFPSVD
jgi:uncharacterized protein (DUF1778 family)